MKTVDISETIEACDMKQPRGTDGNNNNNDNH